VPAIPTMIEHVEKNLVGEAENVPPPSRATIYRHTYIDVYRHMLIVDRVNPDAG